MFTSKNSNADAVMKNKWHKRPNQWPTYIAVKK